MIKSKRISVGVALFCVFALLLSSTFAWQQMVQKTNEFIGTGGGILHDDFDPKTGKKDIYVENKSSNPVFVRVKLDEAMNLTDSEWRPEKEDKIIHTFEISAEDCGHTNLVDQKFHDYFMWNMGGQKWYMPASGNSVFTDKNAVTDINEYTQADEANGAKLTPDAVIVTMADYINNILPNNPGGFTGWIYDTDGFAYWSLPLDANGGVTGLLLNKVEWIPALNGTNYYYAIDVQGEIVDAEDLPMWIDGAESVDKSGVKYNVATNSAKELLNWFKIQAAQETP